MEETNFANICAIVFNFCKIVLLSNPSLNKHKNQHLKYGVVLTFHY